MLIGLLKVLLIYVSFGACIIFSNLISNKFPMEMNDYDVVIIAFIFNFAVRKVAAMRGCLIEKLHAL